jgi:hypothetical protein
MSIVDNLTQQTRERNCCGKEMNGQLLRRVSGAHIGGRGAGWVACASP